ncbi:MAG TPA: hypothetical protein GX731_07435, partial [Clostridiales bacterium]|nr:hypothetical protein [Clostridiales bacterium]
EWIDKLAMAIAGAIGQSNQKGNSDRANDSDGDVVFKVGEREFGRISIKAINNANRQAGKNLLLV